ncbi:hypothetical protein PYCC9005_000342 [Savitreella phatthalungensis]
MSAAAPPGGERTRPRFAPKEPVDLAPPKFDVIPDEYLSKCTGHNEGYPILVGIRGLIFDVTHNPVYAVGKGYNVFAGADASKALAKSSLEKADVSADISELDESEIRTLDEWLQFFRYRYNVVGMTEKDAGNRKQGVLGDDVHIPNIP